MAVLFIAPTLRAEPLHDAAKAGSLEAVKQLLDQGADLQSFDELGETPLTAAALAGQLASVKLLLARGADINGRNAGGFTLLHAAAYHGHTEIVAIALDLGAPIDDQKNKARITPLHGAVERNHFDTATFLVERGARIDLKELNGWTPTARATFKRFGPMVQYLRDKGGECPAQSVVGAGHNGFCLKPDG